MTAIIKIEEQGYSLERFDISIRFDDTDQNFLTQFKTPYNKEIEEQFEWYFEKYIQEPYTPIVTVNRHKKSLFSYGENLFRCIFMNNDTIFQKYKKLILENSGREITIEIIGDSAAFHAIHWESLKDPDLSEPLAAYKTIFYRKSHKLNPIKIDMSKSPFINLLIVTARPDEGNDVNYRTIQRPLIKTIRKAKIKVKPHILRPGTYSSLREHLNQIPKGFYHIIHFDLHGGYLDYATLREYAFNGRMDIHSRDVLGTIQPYGGKKNFIFFESDKKGVSIPIDACEFANLFKNKLIPICIMNACQSAKQEQDNNESSFAQELLIEGIQLILVMRYSVSVSAVELFMRKLYSSLFYGKSVETSVALSRRELYEKKDRKAWFGHTISVEDWLLPILFKNSDVNFNLRALTREEEKKFSKECEKYHCYAPPQFGFHGRDLDILKIEKQLLRHNHLLFQGMGGAGKTTFLNYVIWWWQETGFIDHAFYFAYNQRAWTIDQIIFEIAQKLIPLKGLNSFIGRPFAEQKKEILSLLNSQKHILILDSTESITGKGIPNMLSETELFELKNFLSKIEENTFVILGSRSDECWLRDLTFKDNVYTLRGFDKEATFAFAQSILINLNIDIDEIIQNSDFNRLLNLLSGYPLALQVILPNLNRYSPQQILYALQTGNVELDGDNPHLKEQSIIKCIEYTYSNISDSTKKFLSFLTPFQSTIILNFIHFYFEGLKNNGIYKDFQCDNIKPAIEEAFQNGFMQEISTATPFLIRLQPVFTYFLKRTVAENYGRDFIEIMESTFIQYYNNFNLIIEKALMKSKNIKNERIGLLLFKHEYGNLLAAVEMAIRKNETVIYLYNGIVKSLEEHKNYEEILVISKRILKRFENIHPKELNEELLKEYVCIIDMIGNTYAQMNDLGNAERWFVKLLDICGEEKRQKVFLSNMGCIYLNLGAVFRDSQDLERSENYLKMALKEFLKSKDRKGQANAFQNLGVLLKEKGEYKKSMEHFKKALNLYIQIGDLKYQAKIYENLGDIARVLKKYKLSTHFFEKAAELYIRSSKKNNLGTIYLNLGKVMLDAERYLESLNFYKKALEVFIPLNDKYHQAQVYMDMGRVELSWFQLLLNQQKIQVAFEILQESLGYFQKSVEIAIQSGNMDLQKMAEKQIQIILEYACKILPEILKISMKGFQEMFKSFPRELPEN